ncbi:hypothetical protein B0H11DRAFT_2221466 [Mycena galericulata]|nr:hypothetical protein B0H11DRAFT_2221466 [Mycena galericulata]
MSETSRPWLRHVTATEARSPFSARNGSSTQPQPDPLVLSLRSGCSGWMSSCVVIFFVHHPAVLRGPRRHAAWGCHLLTLTSRSPNPLTSDSVPLPFPPLLSSQSPLPPHIRFQHHMPMYAATMSRRIASQAADADPVLPLRAENAPPSRSRASTKVVMSCSFMSYMPS